MLHAYGLNQSLTILATCPGLYNPHLMISSLKYQVKCFQFPPLNKVIIFQRIENLSKVTISLAINTAISRGILLFSRDWEACSECAQLLFSNFVVLATSSNFALSVIFQQHLYSNSVIKFRYNTRYHGLKERARSEYKAQI